MIRQQFDIRFYNWCLIVVSPMDFNIRGDVYTKKKAYYFFKKKMQGLV